MLTELFGELKTLGIQYCAMCVRRRTVLAQAPVRLNPGREGFPGRDVILRLGIQTAQDHEVAGPGGAGHL